MKMTLAAIGAVLILIGIYMFPFGQDMFMLWLTGIAGTQQMAWSWLYLICFGLIAVGFMFGGVRLLGISRLAGIFRMLSTNPVGLAFLLGLMYIIYIMVSPYIGV